jgi:hypothetical protein
MYRTSSKLASRPRPKVQLLGNRGPLPQFFLVALKWCAAWAVIGCMLGLLLMLGKAEPLAESGAKPSSIFAYVFWVPALAGGAAAGGLAIGLIFAGFMTVTTDWRDSLADTPGMLAQVGPQIMCGAGAGLVAGLLAGGIGGALFFGALGACTAAGFYWMSVR